MTPVTRGRNDLWGGLIVAIGIVLAITAFAGVSLFQIGAVGFFVWLALTRKQGWAWLPAAFFGFHVAQDLLDGVGGSLFFPLMVVAGGVLMLSRDRLSKNATIGILLMLAVIGIASSNRDGDRSITVDLDRPPRAAAPAAPPPAELPEADHTVLPALRGRDLVIDAGARDIELTRSTSRRGGVLSEDSFELLEKSDLVLLDVPVGDEPFEVRVPAESQVVVRTTTGDVKADISGIGLTVDSFSGDLDISLVGEHAVTAETTSGEINAEGLVDFEPSDQVLLTEPKGSRVRLESLSGSISISQT